MPVRKTPHTTVSASASAAGKGSGAASSPPSQGHGTGIPRRNTFSPADSRPQTSADKPRPPTNGQDIRSPSDSRPQTSADKAPAPHQRSGHSQVRGCNEDNTVGDDDDDDDDDTNDDDDDDDSTFSPGDSRPQTSADKARPTNGQDIRSTFSPGDSRPQTSADKARPTNGQDIRSTFSPGDSRPQTSADKARPTNGQDIRSKLPNSSSYTSDVTSPPAARPKGHTKSASMPQPPNVTDLPPLTTDTENKPT
ncbi:hypothetical protein ACOMHN_063287 [Nucella lapillus]